MKKVIVCTLSFCFAVTILFTNISVANAIPKGDPTPQSTVPVNELE